MEEPYLDPAEWPRWFHHVTRQSVLCHTPEEAAALPRSFRKEPWSEEEKYQHAREQQAKAEATRKHAVLELEEALEEPVVEPAPPPPPKVRYRPPSRAKGKERAPIVFGSQRKA
jgi:hypothetical protein